MYGKIQHRLPRCKKQVSAYTIITILTTELAYVQYFMKKGMHNHVRFIQVPTSAGAASATSELQSYTNY